MVFDWDDENIRHIAAHDVSCDEAEQVINNEPVDLDVEIRNGEERFSQIGETLTARILLVVTTWRGTKLRVVTAFEPIKSWRKFYLRVKGNPDEHEVGDP
jgi:uncharacterized protein